MYYEIFIFTAGLILASASPRIIGGSETTIEKHPWQVSIQSFSNHVCGGSIINADTVVTAAHCVIDLLISVTQVIPGVTDLRQATLKISVLDFIVHDDYDSDTYDYDIAILKLQESLIFSEKIKPISLPEESFVVPDGSVVTASGWGATEPDGGSLSDILREVQVNTVNWQICKEKLSSIGEFTERMMCAGVPQGGKDTCAADSGGALELNGTLIGIVSWGEGCGEADYPGIYIRVNYLRSWIREHSGV